MIPSEEAEQVMLVQWLELMGLKFSSIPNSTYTTSWKVKTRNTRTGLRPGLPDLLVALPGVGVIWIELKRTKRGVVSAVQQSWVDTLNACPGNQAYICLGADAAIAIIESFIKLEVFEF